jgi:predicted phage baseplate assembly protein
MNVMRKSKQNAATCDCCEGVEVLTPIEIYNRPGLDAISYRVGTHGSFLETMKARLSSSVFPKLAELTTREDRDPSMALLDAWATVGDVLTFYQERIANEGYLRTAIERRSVLELARLVGYRLRPGLSASVYLAYTLEPTQPSTFIDIGNKAQSIPGPNELPQIFETAEKLTAYSGLNVMKARVTQPQLFSSSLPPEITIVAKGASLSLRINDGILLHFTMLNSPEEQDAFYRVTDVTPAPELDRTTLKLRLEGNPPQFPPPTPPNSAPKVFDKVNAILKKYLVVEDFALSPTSKTVAKVSKRVNALGSILNAPGTTDTVKLSNLRTELETLVPFLTNQYAFAFGHGWDTIAVWLTEIINELLELRELLTATGSNAKPENTFTVAQDIKAGLPSFAELFAPFKLPQSLQPPNEARLSRRIPNIFAPRSEFVAQMYGVIQPQAAPFVKAVLTNAAQVTRPTPSPKTEGVIGLTTGKAFRGRAFIAGHNLPVVRDTSDKIVLPPTFQAYLTALGGIGLTTIGGVALTQPQDLSVIALDAEYDQIKVGSRIVIKRPTLNANGGISGFKVTTHTVKEVNPTQIVFLDIPFTSTVVTLDSAWLPAAEITQNANSIALVRNTYVFAQSEDLTLVETELSEEMSFTPNDPVIELDGLYSNLEPGRWTIISGERIVIDTHTNTSINTGVIVSELVMVASVAHEAKTLVNGAPAEVKGEKLHTFLHAAQPPAYRYRRSTVKIYGNVVRATHGETRNEVLGSGDGSKTLQSFQLLQPPLTFLAAPVPSGTESTLALRVNEVLWSEADNLFALAPNVRKYITKTDDQGKTTVIFGDGEHGARLLTGIENVKAVYRQGLGKGGNVKADQIKLPLTKPLGVKSVINPLPASGGVDKETRDQARRNAPIAVLALDRLVSVQDYADFARTFAGIAKASAQRLSDGDRAVVHLTIAGAGNIHIDVTSDLYRNLLLALARFGDPLQPVQVESFERVLLVVSAKVRVLPEYLWENVKEKMRAKLWEKLDFENRELGQDVTLSEVLSLMQSVPGVDYVDFDLLDSVSEETLKDPNFGSKLALKPRVRARLARMNKAGTDILPAQLVFLSRDAVDTLILEEIAV